MLLIVGLGNPEKEYTNTRHNLGFLIVDQLATHFGVEYKNHKYAQGELAKNDQVLLLKPQTYVNKSGEAVRHVADQHAIELGNIWVVHDDADLPFGEIRIKQGGSSGGHNGIKSIDEAVGPNYWRIRVGIGRDENFKELSDYVLSPFSHDEQKQLASIIDRVVSYLIQSIDQEKLTPGSLITDAKEKH
jgi:PTH1 family peptidyl-tRNA hydrolase